MHWGCMCVYIVYTDIVYCIYMYIQEHQYFLIIVLKNDFYYTHYIIHAIYIHIYIYIYIYIYSHYTWFSVKNFTVPSYEHEASCGNNGLYATLLVTSL